MPINDAMTFIESSYAVAGYESECATNIRWWGGSQRWIVYLTVSLNDWRFPQGQSASSNTHGPSLNWRQVAWTGGKLQPWCNLAVNMWRLVAPIIILWPTKYSVLIALDSHRPFCGNLIVQLHFSFVLTKCNPNDHACYQMGAHSDESSWRRRWIRTPPSQRSRLGEAIGYSGGRPSTLPSLSRSSRLGARGKLS